MIQGRPHYGELIILHQSLWIHLRFYYRETSEVDRLEIIVSMENHSRLFQRFLLVYISSVSKGKITQPYAQKLGGLLANDNKVVIRIICDCWKSQRAYTKPNKEKIS